MAIEHKDIQEPNIHEPKGVATASVGTAYMATGTGTGSWRKLVATDLAGITSTNSGDRVLIAQGGTFTTLPDFSIGSMLILNNANGFATTAATDPTLLTESDYALLTGNGAPWQTDVTNVMRGVTFNTNRLTVSVTGIYKIEMWAVITSFPSTTSKVGLAYRKNGTDFGASKAIVKANGAGDYGNISAFAITQLQANDYIQLMLASTVTGNVIFDSVRFTVQLLKVSQ